MIRYCTVHVKTCGEGPTSFKDSSSGEHESQHSLLWAMLLMWLIICQRGQITLPIYTARINLFQDRSGNREGPVSWPACSSVLAHSSPLSSVQLLTLHWQVHQTSQSELGMPLFFLFSRKQVFSGLNDKRNKKNVWWRKIWGTKYRKSPIPHMNSCCAASLQATIMHRGVTMDAEQRRSESSAPPNPQDSHSSSLS